MPLPFAVLVLSWSFLAIAGKPVRNDLREAQLQCQADMGLLTSDVDAYSPEDLRRAFTLDTNSTDIAAKRDLSEWVVTAIQSGVLTEQQRKVMEYTIAGHELAEIKDLMDLSEYMVRLHYRGAFARLMSLKQKEFEALSDSRKAFLSKGAAEWLREQLTLRNMTAADLADISGMGPTRVREAEKILAGETPTSLVATQTLNLLRRYFEKNRHKVRPQHQRSP
jgi:DNA-binding CsgD family transcriptional regulator